MNPKECRYSKEHEWVCPEAGNIIKVGITSYAQDQLGDIVFLDLPAPDTEVQQFKKLGEVESVKAVSEIFSPVSGNVIEVNQKIIEHPEIVNRDPYGAGWLVRIEMNNQSELNALMDNNAYDKLVSELSEEKK